MGAQAIDLDLDTLEGAGGYAREMTEERADRQRELLTPYIAAADALITTAAVPGRRAPLLVTRDMVERMGPGSVVVDLAAEAGGNVEGVEPGKTVRIGNAQLWGALNVPSQMPGPASQLLSQNIVNLLTLMTGERGFAPDFNDEVVAGCCVTHDGEVLHEPTRELLTGESNVAPDAQPVAVEGSRSEGTQA
jgi:NAD(P) transhydrogenase subunit alpha